MANITEEHLHHMARRHHATMKKLEAVTESKRKVFHGFKGVAEIGAGAWLGGAIEGRWDGKSIGPIPINLGIGAALLVAGHMNVANGKWNADLTNLGNGFLGSYLAAVGYKFGQNLRAGGSLFGGLGHPYSMPTASAGADLDEAQMAALVQRMQHAAATP